MPGYFCFWPFFVFGLSLFLAIFVFGYSTFWSLLEQYFVIGDIDLKCVAFGLQTTNMERVFALLVMVLGGAFYALIIGGDSCL